nr:GNAT family N-acetyltransferase [Pseudooceanicola sp. HF7]
MTLIARLIKRGAVRLIRDAKGPCAFIARDDTVIQALYVHSRARRHGHGRRLLRDAKARAPSLSLWTYEAAHIARHFYACEGFTPAAWGDGRGNDEHLPELLLLWTAPSRQTEAA